MSFSNKTTLDEKNVLTKTVLAGRAALNGQTKGIRALLPFLGPTFIASIAYMDPGNFATNIQSGAQFGYKMLSVVVLANRQPFSTTPDMIRWRTLQPLIRR